MLTRGGPAMQVELVALVLSVVFTFICAYIVLFVSAGVVILAMPALLLLYGVAYAAFLTERNHLQKDRTDFVA